ncbi:MAG: hypothetical protein ACR2QJ_02020, partial [Geminicoccaceae bacterium]
EPPSLPLADMVTVLLERPASAPIDRLALLDDVDDGADVRPLADEGFMDAAALPSSSLFHVQRNDGGRQPSGDLTSPSQIAIIGKTTRAQGIYIANHYILTPSDVVGDQGLVDIEDSPGHKALGLVAAVDHGLGLALIHASAPGRPVAIGSEPGIPRNDFPVGTLRRQPSSSAPKVSAPVLAGGRLVGFKTTRGPDIEGNAIRTFLDRQRQLLAGRSPGKT